MSISLKPGVRCFGIHPEILLAIVIAEGVFAQHGSNLIVTSLSEGKHSPGSHHYIGYSFDARTWWVEDPEAVARDLREALGADFQVVVEYKPPHIHVEFDPQKPLTG